MTGAAALFLSVFARTALLPVVEIKPAGAEERRGEERRGEGRDVSLCFSQPGGEREPADTNICTTFGQQYVKLEYDYSPYR